MEILAESKPIAQSGNQSSRNGAAALKKQNISYSMNVSNASKNSQAKNQYKDPYTIKQQQKQLQQQQDNSYNLRRNRNKIKSDFQVNGDFQTQQKFSTLQSNKSDTNGKSKNNQSINKSKNLDQKSNEGKEFKKAKKRILQNPEESRSDFSNIEKRKMSQPENTQIKKEQSYYLPQIQQRLRISTYYNDLKAQAYQNDYFEQRQNSISNIGYKSKTDYSPNTKTRILLNQIMPTYKPREISYTTLQREIIQLPFKADAENELSHNNILSQGIKNLNRQSITLKENNSTYYTSSKNDGQFDNNIYEDSLLNNNLSTLEDKRSDFMYRTAYFQTRDNKVVSNLLNMKDSQSMILKNKRNIAKNNEPTFLGSASYENETTISKNSQHLDSKSSQYLQSKTVAQRQYGNQKDSFQSIDTRSTLIPESRNHMVLNNRTAIIIEKYSKKVNLDSIVKPIEFSNLDKRKDSTITDKTSNNINITNISVEIKYKESARKANSKVTSARKTQRNLESQQTNQSPRQLTIDSNRQLIQQQIENCNIIYGNMLQPQKISSRNNKSKSREKSPKFFKTLQEPDSLKIGSKRKLRKENSSLLIPLRSSFSPINGVETETNNGLNNIGLKQNNQIVTGSTRNFNNSAARDSSQVNTSKSANHKIQKDSSTLSNSSFNKYKIAKPSPFKLKDLPKYSQTLKLRDIDNLKLGQQLLGGKYFKQPKPEVQQESPRRNIEWTKTPVFKQFVLKLTETQSLEDLDIGFRKHKAKNKGKTLQQFMLDHKNKKLMKDLLAATLANIYSEPELEFFIKTIKHKNQNKEEMGEIYEKAVDTLEVLMCKLGLQDQFQKLFEIYEAEKKESLRQTLIKILHRGKIMYVSLSKIHVIFKLIIRRDNVQLKIHDLEQEIAALEPDVTPQIQQLDSLEQEIASYCYQSSRLYIQITSFIIESHLFKRLKFIYEGIDYQAKIRKQIYIIKGKFEKYYGQDKIPTMNQLGKLVFAGEDDHQDKAHQYKSRGASEEKIPQLDNIIHQ